MNTVKIDITRLGPLRDTSLELSPLMVFSGESGLGKSYAAFLVHYLYMLLATDRLKGFFREKGYDYSQLFNRAIPGKVILSISTEELRSWINKDAITYIRYLLGNDTFAGEVDIKLIFDDEQLNFTFDKETVGIEKNEVYYRIELGNTNYQTKPEFLISNELAPFVELTKHLVSLHLFGMRRYSYLLPPSRGSLMGVSIDPAFKSGMYVEFYKILVRDVSRPLEERPQIDKNIIQYLYEINEGDVKIVDDEVMYYTRNVAMPVRAAASSIKELAPLTLLLQKYPIEGMSILFEEPEAHLHPNRQIKVADLIGCAVQKGCHMQITTHSDYFIKRLNSLMMLHQLKEKDVESYQAISEKWKIKEDCLINPQNVGAYLFESKGDGTSRIVKQELTDEGIPFKSIPFTSFYRVIEDDIDMYRELRKAFND